MEQISKKKILIVEDDLFMAGLLARKFEKKNFEILKAGSADQARDLLKENPIAAILLDVILPGTDGFTFLKELKSTPNFKEIPIIITSNLGQEEEIQKGLQEGASGYIVKAHASPTEIVQKVEEVLKK